MKRILSMILVVVMALGCFAVVGSAGYDSDANDQLNFKSSYDATKYTSTYVCTKVYDSRSYKYTYDSNGYLIKSVCTYDDYYGTSTEINTFTYNSNKRLIKCVDNYNGSKYTTTYSYDSNGNYTGGKAGSSGTSYYNSNGTLRKNVENEYYVTTITYSYNSKGYLSKRVLTAGGETYVDTYSYDSNGNITKMVETYNGSFYYGNYYTYDSHGNLIKRTQKDEHGGIEYLYTHSWKKITTSSPVIAGKIHVQYATTKYTGKAKKPSITIDGLIQGRDYKVTYSNNVNVGTAKAKISFFNSTQQPVTITFRITGSGSSSSSSSATYYKTTASLRLRKGPSTSYSTILTMPSGAKVKYLGSKSNGFYKVSYTKNGKTYTGWCSSSYLKKA